MKKKLLTIATAALLASGVGLAIMPQGEAQAEGQATKVRAVDLDRVIQKSTSAKAIMRDFQLFQKKKQDELRKEQAALEAEQRRLTPGSPKAELEAYGKKVQATAQKLQKAEMEIQQRFAETRAKLLKALRPTFESYSRNNSIGMLIDSTTGGVVYVSPSWDTTSEVLKQVK
jgi:Skp family chaperone for outer membrane proteins